MLLELNITDFAIIERLRLTLGPGFNVFTGRRARASQSS